MPLVDMHDLLNHAARNQYAVAAFGLPSTDLMAAVLAAAERCRAPAILSVDESDFSHGDLELAIVAAERAAQRASVPVALQYRGGASLAAAVRAINLGCNGVSVRAAQASFPAAVSATRGVSDVMRACGIAVEGRLGHAGEPDSAGASSVEEERAFAQRAGIDCLAVSLGSANGARPRSRAKPDLDRLRRLRDAVQIPLAIQDGSGFTDEQLHRLIQCGVAKIDCERALVAAAAGHLRGAAYAEAIAAVRAAVQKAAEQCLQRWGAAGRAAEVLVQCRTWQPVQHVILYNVEGADDAAVESMMARGREVLAQIPGVRRVVTGWAVTDKPRYRCCWLVEFTHEKVIAVYRDHPLHQQFANELFRPIAGDRISIDFVDSVQRPRSDHLTTSGARALPRRLA